MSTPTLITAKNSGLARQVDLALDSLRLSAYSRLEVRGEDVAQLTSDLAQRGRRVIGVTGEDLLEEWLAAGNALDPRLARSARPWQDASAVYGGPALCLIGAPGTEVGDRARIAICSKYRFLAERYIATLERERNVSVERIYVAGALENVQLLGLADFIIDIIVTGATAKRCGLVVSDVISRSNLALLETA